MASPLRVPRSLLVALLLGVLAGCTKVPGPQVGVEQPPTEIKTPAESLKAVATAPLATTLGNCYIHDQKRDAKNLSFLGWAVGSPTEGPQSIDIAVEVGGKVAVYTTRFYDRPDIAKAYNNPALLKTGFIAAIPNASVPAGSSLSVLIRGSKNSYQCKNVFKAI